MTFVTNINCLSKIVEKYDIFILDQWGVMHDGVIAYPHAIDCVNKLLQLKKKLIIISNTSKRNKVTFDQLVKLKS